MSDLLLGFGGSNVLVSARVCSQHRSDDVTSIVVWRTKVQIAAKVCVMPFNNSRTGQEKA